MVSGGTPYGERETEAGRRRERQRDATAKKRNQSNINPTPEAVMAMVLWCEEYSHQNGGSMDFWDGLSEAKKGRCQYAVARVLAAAVCHKTLKE